MENSSGDGNTRLPYLPPEKCVCRSRSTRTGHGTTDWFQIGKGVRQGYILSPCLFNLYAKFSSFAQSCPILCNPMNHSMPGLPVHHQLLEFTSIESVMPSSHLILCRPLLLLPSIFPRIRVFSSESALCIRWPKYWSFSFSISPSMNVQD